jgi:hypothetical protein
MWRTGVENSVLSMVVVALIREEKRMISLSRPSSPRRTVYPVSSSRSRQGTTRARFAGLSQGVPSHSLTRFDPDFSRK